MIYLILEIEGDGSEGLPVINGRGEGYIIGRVGWSESSSVSSQGLSLEEVFHAAGKLISRHRLVSCGVLRFRSRVWGEGVGDLEVGIVI